MHLIHRQTCRICGSSQLKTLIDLGDQYLQGSFVKPEKELPPTRKIPLQLVRCDPSKDESACGLLQMAHSVPPSILYSSYWYLSGTNQTMRNHLKGIVDDAVKMLDEKNLCVLDIGCNDGTLLNYYPDDTIKIGIDPSDISKKMSGDIQIINDLFPTKKVTSLIGSNKFDIITAIAMFYDVENPVEFINNIKEILSDIGIWIFEVSYMPTMLEMNSYDTICHEHLEYYSLAVIEYVLKKANMKIVRATLNDINGGTIRCYTTHTNNFKFDNEQYRKELDELRKKEFDTELDTDKPYKNFQERINVHREELINLIKKIKSEGKKIHIYGASTKGNTILQWCGINNYMIDYAAERNPDKYGARTLGTDIPIISEEDSRALQPDYYLVLPWHFRKEFIEREKDILKNGTKMIFPLPKVEIISFQDIK